MAENSNLGHLNFFWKFLSVASKYIGQEKSIGVSLVQIGWVLAESLLLEWWPWDTKTKSVSDFLLQAVSR